jgi:hypothetical protein
MHRAPLDSDAEVLPETDAVRASVLDSLSCTLLYQTPYYAANSVTEHIGLRKVNERRLVDALERNSRS